MIQESKRICLSDLFPLTECHDQKWLRLSASIDAFQNQRDTTKQENVQIDLQAESRQINPTNYSLFGFRFHF